MVTCASKQVFGYNQTNGVVRVEIPNLLVTQKIEILNELHSTMLVGDMQPFRADILHLD